MGVAVEQFVGVPNRCSSPAQRSLGQSCQKTLGQLHFAASCFWFREIPWHIDSNGKLDSRTQLEAARKAGRCLTLTSREQVVIVPASFCRSQLMSRWGRRRITRQSCAVSIEPCLV